MERAHPGALASQWIPNDPSLWKIAKFREFLEARKALLAAELNRRMEELLHGDTRWLSGPAATLRPIAEVTDGMASEEEEEQLEALNEWIEDQGLPRGMLAYDFADADTGEQKAVFDLAWPNGIQEELSQPVAVLLNESAGNDGHCQPGGLPVLHRSGGVSAVCEQRDSRPGGPGLAALIGTSRAGIFRARGPGFGGVRGPGGELGLPGHWRPPARRGWPSRKGRLEQMSLRSRSISLANARSLPGASDRSCDCGQAATNVQRGLVLQHSPTVRAIDAARALPAIHDDYDGCRATRCAALALSTPRGFLVTFW